MNNLAELYAKLSAQYWKAEQVAGWVKQHFVSRATYENEVVKLSAEQSVTNKTIDSTNLSGLTAKTTPVDADSAVIVDSAASNAFKRTTFTNIKAFLKTYFDTLYASNAAISVRAFHDANQSIPNITYTALSFNSENYDNGNFHNTVTNNSHFFAPIVGKYLITASASFVSNATGARIIKIMRTGTTDLVVSVQNNNGSSYTVQLNVATVAHMGEDDYVQALVWQDSGDALNVQANTAIMTVTFLGT